MRDEGLEELVREHIGGEPGITAKPMFGGLALLLDGNLLCGMSAGRLMIRLGKGLDGWALEHSGVTRLVAARPMPGWVFADEDAYGDDDLRARLLDAALDFVRGLPPK